MKAARGKTIIITSHDPLVTEHHGAIGPGENPRKVENPVPTECAVFIA